jgi:hypothetical protein
MSALGPSLPTSTEAFAVGLLSLALVPAPAPAPASAPLLRLRALAIDTAAGAPPRTQTLEIAIERWTDEAPGQERDTVETQPVPLPREAAAMLPRAGYIRRDTGIGWDVQYARLQPLPSGGRRVVFATDGPWSVVEPESGVPTRAYEYVIGEILLGADGIGEGQLATSGEPVRLSQVVVEGIAPRRP